MSSSTSVIIKQLCELSISRYSFVKSAFNTEKIKHNDVFPFINSQQPTVVEILLYRVRKLK